MEPSLHDGDRILAFRTKRLSGKLNGRVVVAHDPRNAELVMIKRLVEVDKDSFVVHGDNAVESTDSRVLGRFPRESFIGIALYRYFPIGEAGRIT